MARRSLVIQIVTLNEQLQLQFGFPLEQTQESYFISITPHLLYPNALQFIFNQTWACFESYRTVLQLLQLPLAMTLVYWEYIFVRPLTSPIYGTQAYAQHTGEQASRSCQWLSAPQ
jgi:hypothetical protein